MGGARLAVAGATADAASAAAMASGRSLASKKGRVGGLDRWIVPFSEGVGFRCLYLRSVTLV